MTQLADRVGGRSRGKAALHRCDWPWGALPAGVGAAGRGSAKHSCRQGPWLRSGWLKRCRIQPTAGAHHVHLTGAGRRTTLSSHRPELVTRRKPKAHNEVLLSTETGRTGTFFDES